MRILAAWSLIGLLGLLPLLIAPGGNDAAIVPDQLVSFMHILYSSIPVIRKGTDSRLGFGFRFGPHADAQVLVELGPQRLTDQLTEITTPRQTVFDPDKRHVHDDPLAAVLLQDHHAVSDVLDNHIGRSQSRALQFAPGPEVGGRGGEWLSRWRAGWSSPSIAAPQGPQRPSRGLRIALAVPTTVSAAPATSTASSAIPKSPSVGGTAATPTRYARAQSKPVLTTAHLREAMEQLSARMSSSTTTATPRRTSPTPTPHRQRQPQLFQGGILRVLRQLWQTGAGAPNRVTNIG